jgi:hypothetical protein
MDAKYNWVMDNFGVRVAINIAVFTAWLVASYALLKM